MAVTLKFDDATDADDALAKHVAPTLVPGIPHFSPEELKAKQAQLDAAFSLPGEPRKTLVMPKGAPMETQSAPIQTKLIAPVGNATGAPTLVTAAPPSLVGPSTGLRAPGTAAGGATDPWKAAGTMPELSAAPMKHTGWRAGLGRFGSGLKRFGAGLADVVVPGVMQRIPGTELNQELQENRKLARNEQAAETNLKNAETQHFLSETNPSGNAEQWKPIGEPKQDPASGQWEQLGESQDASGKITRSWQPIAGGPALGAPKEKPQTDQEFMAAADQQLSKGTISQADRERLGGMQRAAKLQGIAPEIVAQVGQPPVPADFPKGTGDPDYKKFNEAWGKEVERVKNEESSASGAARGAGYNQSRPVQVADENGNLVWMSAGEAEARDLAPAAEAVKTGGRIAQMNDIENASKQVRAALKETGNESFSPTQVAKLTMAMKETDPTVMRNEIANLAASGLTPAQQDLVTWLYQLQERALSLRSIAGMGQGSETTRLAILKALPGITSGNTEMAFKQLDAFDNMVKNLRGGIPNVKGKLGSGTAGGGENQNQNQNQDRNTVMSPAEWLKQHGG